MGISKRRKRPHQFRANITQPTSVAAAQAEDAVNAAASLIAPPQKSRQRK